MSDLKRVIQLANLMVEQRQRVDALKTDLEKATADLRAIETVDLPELMREVGMKSVTLDDGSMIDLVDEVDCGITEAKRPEAHKWLIENGFGGLIKTEVVVAFGRGEHEAALKCAEEVGGTAVERVHPATLKSFVKEQLAAGRAVPFDTFGVYPYSKAKLKKA
jgi:hypothetical protein